MGVPPAVATAAFTSSIIRGAAHPVRLHIRASHDELHGYPGRRRRRHPARIRLLDLRRIVGARTVQGTDSANSSRSVYSGEKYCS
ncbi:hypothetical protein PG994_014312 [Apiospora phragmitis]|uniref:Uncharacterized protein n=1 Tax=Apiospora phragmitis TaxID=2905665 RepID=A0ABR1T3Y5_9PEZI